MGPKVTWFDPPAGRPRWLVTIHGSDFAAERTDNQVEVGHRPAFVISVSPVELKVLTTSDVRDGPVRVTVGAHTRNGPHVFRVLGYPLAGSG